jgi:putative oxidoreductase
MTSLYNRGASLFTLIPSEVIALIASICIGAGFMRSGLLKLNGWENAVFLFENEYKLPDLPVMTPEITAYLTTAAELALPALLFAGLLTRFAALGLLIMTLVIQIFVYPNAFDTHGVWAIALLFLMKYGAGRFSLDNLLFRDRGAV